MLRRNELVSVVSQLLGGGGYEEYGDRFDDDAHFAAEIIVGQVVKMIQAQSQERKGSV